METDRLPEILEGRIQSRKFSGGNAVVVHYTSPYEEMGIPYNAIKIWPTENKREASGLPFESCLNKPVTVKNKYEL